MRLKIRPRRTLNFLLTAALLLGQMAVFMALPRHAQAAPSTNLSADPNAVSADPNAEIIYVDENGVIRVFDTQGSPLVQWVSPDGGWDQIVLLDVNDDSDMEIFALDQISEFQFRLAVFDPVFARGATDPNKQFNGIPWDTLWTITANGNGEYIVGGNFDNNIPGDELAVGFRNGNTSVVQIWNANSLDQSTQKPTGRDWKLHIQKEYPNTEYTYGTAGQLDGENADELILFDPESAVTRMDIYRPDRDMLLADSETSSNDRFKQGVAGQIIEDGKEELVAILTVDKPTKASLRTYIMGNDGEVEEDAKWAFAPQPDWLFLADIRGNGDKEVFFLRNFTSGAAGPRLIMRDDWGDDNKQNQNLIEWNLMDDGSKNEFRAGAGGDVDGDGRDEVILLRDDRIRIYGNPENGNESAANFTDHFFNTDNRRLNLLAGDLDRIGFTTGPILAVSGNMIDAIIPAGTMSQQFFVNVQNVGAQGGVTIQAIIPSGNGWAELNPTLATTPANFRIQFNATSLSPGQYKTTMTLRAVQPNVQNDNYVVYLNLTVVPPVLQPSPPILSIFRFPCEADPCSPSEIEERNAPFTSTVRINGSSDLTFRAAILGVPEASNVATIAATGGLPGPITGGSIDANGNIVIYDNQGNSRTLAENQVSAAATQSTTVILDPSLTWVTSATLDSDVVPADLAIAFDPTILTAKFQREYAVLVLVADTRAGTPSENVKLVPIQLANIGQLLWLTILLNGQ